MAEVAGKAVGDVDRRARDAAQRAAQRDARRRQVEASSRTRPARRSASVACPARRNGERGVAQRARHVDVVARPQRPRASAPGRRALRRGSSGTDCADRASCRRRRDPRRSASASAKVRARTPRATPRRRRAARRPATPSAAARPSPPCRTGSPPASCARAFRGSASAKKCRPATSMSTETTSSCPGDGASTAASSPTPSTTDGERGGREKKRAISSNSFTAPRPMEAPQRRTNVDGARATEPQAAPPTARSIASARISSARTRRRELVEHAVDELVAVGAAIGLRELDRLVDHHAIGNLRPVLQLPRADHENRALDRRKLRGATVEARRNESRPARRTPQ